MKKLSRLVFAFAALAVFAGGSIAAARSPRPVALSANPQPQCDPGIPHCNPGR